ncbi:MAG: 30S ribosomal protein S16 [Bacteroidota bacterium]
MATKIRLALHGKKGKPFFHIVIADERAPRDGKYIEKIGVYDPQTIPATIEIDFNKALHWVEKGAQPSDTCRAILSYKGILYRNHLNVGVKKGALTQEQADAKFEKWIAEKEGKVSAHKNKVAADKVSAEKSRLAAETKVREAKAEALAKAAAEVPAAEPEVEAPATDAPAAEENSENA